MRLVALILTSLLAVFPLGTIARAEVSVSATDLPFSQACVAWKLVASKTIGKGWIFSAFCKNDKGVYGWDENNHIDDCVGADIGGRLVHAICGDMSLHCSECNNNDSWGHTSHGDHALVCNCTNAQGETVTSSLDLDTTYGYRQNSIYCLAIPATIAERAPCAAPDIELRDICTTDCQGPSPKSGSVEVRDYDSRCDANFQLTGNSPYAGAYNPRVMWTQFVDDQGVWVSASLDLGLCFANDNGTLVPQAYGMFNTTCYDCVVDVNAVPATLRCHCPGDWGATNTSTFPATTVPIMPTVQVVNGVLQCFGVRGDREVTRPTPLRAAAQIQGDTDQELAMRIQPSKKTTGHAAHRMTDHRTPRVARAPQDHCCFYESCSHDLAMRQPEPWLFTRCRRIGEAEPTLVARFDMSRAFMYDRSDWTIKAGDGLYDNGSGCKDCHTGGSWMYCQCVKADGSFRETSIDLNLHISNINGRLCSSSYCGDNEGPTAPIQGNW